MNGRPLIAWAIEIAQASDMFSEVVVSTDDPETAAIARRSGASVPFMRPPHLADDYASTLSVVSHALGSLSKVGFDGALACCIYPASILITPEDLRLARALLLHTGHDYSSAVVMYEHPIQRALKLRPDGSLSFVDPSAATQRTQDLPARWHDAGQFYWGRVAAWQSSTAVLQNSVGYEIPRHRAVDIDTEDDWVRAERLHARTLTD